jgi:hypothetical protein
MGSVIRWARLPLGLLSALLALTIGLGAAAAAPSSAHEHLKTSGDIERAFRARQFETQGAARTIAGENTYAATLAATIASLQSQGKDVTDLEGGLTAFRGRLAASQAELESANMALSVHDGLDAQGNVVDKGLARKTVDLIHSDLLQIKQNASVAKNELHDLLARYDRINGVDLDAHAVEDAF